MRKREKKKKFCIITLKVEKEASPSQLSLSGCLKGKGEERKSHSLEKKNPPDTKRGGEGGFYLPSSRSRLSTPSTTSRKESQKKKKRGRVEMGKKRKKEARRPTCRRRVSAIGREERKTKREGDRPRGQNREEKEGKKEPYPSTKQRRNLRARRARERRG